MRHEQLISSLKKMLAPKIIACVAGVWTPDHKYCLPVQTAAGVIRVSGSRALVLHTPVLNKYVTISDQTLSFEELIQELSIPLSEMVLLFNTSLCSTLDEVEKVIEMMISTGVTSPENRTSAFIKMEVFDDDLHPADKKTIRILEELTPELRSICIPFLRGKENSLQHVSDLGCPAARIWCSDIGQRLGITDKQRLECLLDSTSIPLILEGGLATTQDVKMALAMGFSAVLINSAFRHSPNPIKLASEIRAAIDNMQNTAKISANQSITSQTFPN